MSICCVSSSPRAGAKILPRRITGLTAKQQRDLTTAIKRARIIALLPYVNGKARLG